MRGRKRIPSKIIELRGGTAHTHRPARDVDEPKPPERLPPCPKHLDDRARKHWRWIGKRLLAVRVVTDLDLPTLAGHCQAYSEWVQATEQAAKGLVYKRRDGSPALNPYLRIARDAFDRMLRTGIELGLSPSARARIKVETPKAPGRLQKFMGRKDGAEGEG